MEKKLSKGKWSVRQIAYWAWIAGIVVVGCAYLMSPDMLSPDRIVAFVRTFEGEMLFVYIAASFIRGFFLIPSTPFVLGGAMLFPDQLFLVLAISMAGIMFSASLLYYFSDALGFSRHLATKAPEKVVLWKDKLKRPRAIFLVVGWSFFPFVPTDMVCYVAGIVRMPFRNLFIGVFLGELTLVIFYVYFGQGIFEFVLG